MVRTIAALAFGLTLSTFAAGQATAIPATDFLNSIGVNSAIDRRGETLQHTIECTKYLGIRWFRSGYEGDPALPDLIELHRRTGAKFSWGFLSGGNDLVKLIGSGRELAANGALLAFEGPNEPNNWGITYIGQSGGRNQSWLPVANLQRDLYKAVKGNSILKKYSVWGVSENGAETDNVGLQFLTVPPKAGVLVPDGTKYSDFANVHNYVYHPNSPGLEDNKTWNAADPTSACKVDGLFGEHGLTWARHFSGYSEADLVKLPRVTTETGCAIDGPITEDVHALNLLTLYLDQFKRGWSHTAVYLLRDRSDESGNQQFGFYKADYTPRKAAVYLHNLTTVLADRELMERMGRLSYVIANQPPVVHDLLLEKSDGTFELVVWSELVKGSVKISIWLGQKFPKVTLYDPTFGIEPISNLKNIDSVDLELTNHPVIIEIQRAHR